MSPNLIFAGLSLAAVGFGGRALAQSAPKFTQNLKLISKSWLPSAQSWANSKYYRGGFEAKMTRREAALVMGVSPNAGDKKIREAHKKIMLLNHPDRGGSPFIAAKINQAKEVLCR